MTDEPRLTWHELWMAFVVIGTMALTYGFAAWCGYSLAFIPPMPSR